MPFDYEWIAIVVCANYKGYSKVRHALKSINWIESVNTQPHLDHITGIDDESQLKSQYNNWSKKHAEWKINRLFYLCGRLAFVDSFQFFKQICIFFLSIWKHSFQAHTQHIDFDSNFYFGSTQFSKERVNEKKHSLAEKILSIKNPVDLHFEHFF